MAAINAPYQVKTICTSNQSMSNLPISPFLPNRYNRAKPTTVGGSTRGNKKIASTTDFPKKVLLLITYAKNTHTKKTTTVKILAVLIDIHSRNYLKFSILDHL